MKMRLQTYLSGTTLFVGLRNVEQVGLDLWESESETERNQGRLLIRLYFLGTFLSFTYS